MTQAKKLFMTQMSKLRHQAQETECFKIDTPGHKEADVAPLLTALRECEVEEAFDPHEQEVNVGQVTMV